MIKEFITGKTYRYIGPNKRQSNWNPEGCMDPVLDHLPRKCLEGNYRSARFEDCNYLGIRTRAWIWELDLFEEVMLEDMIIDDEGHFEFKTIGSNI